MSANPQNSFPDKLLDEISRRVYYNAMVKLETELKAQTIDADLITAVADAAAAASAEITPEGGDDDGEESF